MLHNLKRRALLWLCLLGPTFFLGYGWINELTAQRDDVGSFVFSWEYSIPFVEWTIWPYMSIDLLYAISLFCCCSKMELDRHCMRLLLATLVSLVCFLIWPLQMTFERPETEGINGALFDLLNGFDQPYNQAPSLHISLLMVIWAQFNRVLQNPAVRWISHIWMSLIALSVLTTWQHHFIDIVGGAVVAVLVCYIVPVTGWRIKCQHYGKPGVHQALIYLTLALVMTMIALIVQGMAWGLLWPAFSCLMVAAGYLGVGTEIFQRGSLAANWVLAPYRLGCWLSARLLGIWFRGYAEVQSGVWIGPAPGTNTILPEQVTQVLSLAPEVPVAGVHRTQVAMMDLVAPDSQTLIRAVECLEDMYNRNGAVLVHCALGLSRSALVILAWQLNRCPAADPHEMLKRLQRKRPGVRLSPDQFVRLRQYQETLLTAA